MSRYKAVIARLTLQNDSTLWVVGPNRQNVLQFRSSMLTNQAIKDITWRNPSQAKAETHNDVMIDNLVQKGTVNDKTYIFAVDPPAEA